MNKSIPLYPGGRCHSFESFQCGIKNTRKERGLENMIDLKLIRLQLVKRIIVAMDSEFAFDEDGSLWMDDGQWNVLLPDNSISEVLIRFNKNMYPALAADIASRFSGVANPMGLDVIFIGCYDTDSDSTGMVLIKTDE